MYKLRRFETEAEYSAATLNYPSVSWVVSGDTVHYDKTAPVTPKKFQATYSGGETYSLDCDSNTTLSSDNTKPSSYEYSAMTNAVVGDCITNIGMNAFRDCSSLTSVDIPSNVTSIGISAFKECRSLTSVTVPNSVTNIEDSAFMYCTSLSSITLQSGVTHIGNGAFQGCTGLTSIDIPNSVIGIGIQTFYGCSGLTSITVNATTPPSLGLYVFDETNDCPIYVPSQSLEAYKSASVWSSYADRIQAIQ